MSELQPGHIFTLPLKAVYSSTELDQMPFNPDILGHPFVILSLPARGLNAEIALITSLGGQNFMDWAEANPQWAANRVPVDPANSTPYHNIRLRLEGNKQMSKPSYVQTHETQSIPVNVLQQSQNSGRSFTTSSFKAILEELDKANAQPVGGRCSVNLRPAPGSMQSRNGVRQSVSEPIIIIKKDLDKAWRRNSTNSDNTMPIPAPIPTFKRPKIVPATTPMGSFSLSPSPPLKFATSRPRRPSPTRA